MPAGPPGWIHRMHQECGCEFVLAVQGLAPVEVGSGVWIGPTLPGCVEGVAPFHLHLLLLLPLGGKFEGWGVGGYGGACPWLGERQGMIEAWALGKGSRAKGSGDGLIISCVPISSFFSDSSH